MLKLIFFRLLSCCFIVDRSARLCPCFKTQELNATSHLDLHGLRNCMSRLVAFYCIFCFQRLHLSQNCPPGVTPISLLFENVPAQEMDERSANSLMRGWPEERRGRLVQEPKLARGEWQHNSKTKQPPLGKHHPNQRQNALGKQLELSAFALIAVTGTTAGTPSSVWEDPRVRMDMDFAYPHTYISQNPNRECNMAHKVNKQQRFSKDKP